MLEHQTTPKAAGSTPEEFSDSCAASIRKRGISIIPEENTYALGLASSSYEWYRRAAIKARRFYRLSETAQVVAASSIPVCAVLMPESAKVSAILGAFVALITGLRSIFHWHDDYLRFSEAREAIEAERRNYMTQAEPYEDETTRERNLAAAVTRIEQREMDSWKRVASPRRRPKA